MLRSLGRRRHAELVTSSARAACLLCEPCRVEGGWQRCSTTSRISALNGLRPARLTWPHATPENQASQPEPLGRGHQQREEAQMAVARGLDWGNVPAWVGAILTSVSLLIAALAYRRSVKDKEREQASKMAAWIGVVEDAHERKRVVRIRNNSDAPIFDIVARPHGTEPLRVGHLRHRTRGGFAGTRPRTRVPGFGRPSLAA